MYVLDHHVLCTKEEQKKAEALRKRACAMMSRTHLQKAPNNQNTAFCKQLLKPICIVL